MSIERGKRLMHKLIDSYACQTKRLTQITPSLTVHINRNSHHCSAVVRLSLVASMFRYKANDVRHHLPWATAHTINVYRMLAQQGFRRTHHIADHTKSCGRQTLPRLTTNDHLIAFVTHHRWMRQTVISKRNTPITFDY